MPAALEAPARVAEPPVTNPRVLPPVSERPRVCPNSHPLRYVAEGAFPNGYPLAVGVCLGGGHPGNVFILRHIGKSWKLRGSWDPAAVALAAPYRVSDSETGR